MSDNTKYLQSLVGDALARACASTISECSPNDDPVDYLGNWLLRYVKSAAEEAALAQQKTLKLTEQKKELEAAQEAATKASAAEAEKKAAVAALAAMDAEPRALIQHAVELIKTYTTGTMVAASAVADPEEASWVAPEDPEDPAAAESDDEADDPSAAPPPAAEGEEAAAEAPPPDETTEAAEPAAPKIARPIDYSKKYLSYVAAAAGHEWVLSKELRRPGPPPEDAGDDYVPELVPFTFRILDDRTPVVYLPNVAFEPSFKFLGGLPKIGAYQAVGVNVAGETKAVLAADTLFPEGSGQPIKQSDQDLIWEVSLALGKAYEAAEKKAKEALAAKDATESIEALKTKISEIVNAPPPEEPAPEVDAEAAPAESEAPAPTPPAAEEGEAPPEEAAEGPDPTADPLGAARFELRKITKDLAASRTAQSSATKALDVASKVLSAIVEAIKASSTDAIAALRAASPTAPLRATFQALKAALLLLGKSPETLQTWTKMFQYFNEATVTELTVYDATQERNMEAWKLVRAAYKSISNPSKLTLELPNTHFGTLLLMYIKQVRKVGRRAAALRSHTSTTESLTAALASSRVSVAALEEETRLAEEARKAEEEAAAAAAAAEAAAGEGQEGAGEEEAE